MARVLSDILLSNLQDSGRFESVVSGEDIKQMLDMEQQKTAMGCEDDGCMAQIGGGTRRALHGCAHHRSTRRGICPLISKYWRWRRRR